MRWSPRRVVIFLDPSGFYTDVFYYTHISIYFLFVLLLLSHFSRV